LVLLILFDSDLPPHPFFALLLFSRPCFPDIT
jgi:hypothetical protein